MGRNSYARLLLLIKRPNLVELKFRKCRIPNSDELWNVILFMCRDRQIDRKILILMSELKTMRKSIHLEKTPRLLDSYE